MHFGEQKWKSLEQISSEWNIKENLSTSGTPDKLGLWLQCSHHYKMELFLKDWSNLGQMLHLMPSMSHIELRANQTKAVLVKLNRKNVLLSNSNFWIMSWSHNNYLSSSSSCWGDLFKKASGSVVSNWIWMQFGPKCYVGTKLLACPVRMICIGMTGDWESRGQTANPRLHGRWPLKRCMSLSVSPQITPSLTHCCL